MNNNFHHEADLAAELREDDQNAAPPPLVRDLQSRREQLDETFFDMMAAGMRAVNEVANGPRFPKVFNGKRPGPVR